MRAALLIFIVAFCAAYGLALVREREAVRRGFQLFRKGNACRNACDWAHGRHLRSIPQTPDLATLSSRPARTFFLSLFPPLSQAQNQNQGNGWGNQVRDARAV